MKKKIKDQLSSGMVDIIIGSHALLSDKIKFKKLGLIIVDEEQSFGVQQKERLKRLNLMHISNTKCNTNTKNITVIF